MAKRTYKVISYDVWGNKHDGYEVNDAHYTGMTVKLPDDATDKQIVQALKACGYLKKTLKTKSVAIHGDDEFSIYFDDARNGKPEGELRRVEL